MAAETTTHATAGPLPDDFVKALLVRLYSMASSNEFQACNCLIVTREVLGIVVGILDLNISKMQEKLAAMKRARGEATAVLIFSGYLTREGLYRHATSVLHKSEALFHM